MHEGSSDDQQPETSRQGSSPRKQSLDKLVVHEGSCNDQQTSRQYSSSREQSSGSLQNVTARSDNNWRHDQQQDFHQVDMPADNSCLFWAVALAYLIPVRDNDDLFRKRYDDLFGSDETQWFSSVRTSIQTYNYFYGHAPVSNELSHLITKTFRNRVVDYMSHNTNNLENFVAGDFHKYLESMRKSDTWGGEPEILAMSGMLNARISVAGSKTQYGNESETHIQLFHVDLSGSGGGQNHCNFGLEQSIINSDRRRLMVDTITKLQDDVWVSNKFKYNSIDSINNHEISLDKKTIAEDFSKIEDFPKIEDFAKIKWYGNENVMFKVTSEGSAIQIKDELKKLETEENRLLSVIIKLNGGYWVTLVINYKETQFYGHYVDSLGNKLPDTIINAFHGAISKDNFRDYTIINKERTDKSNSGMYALKDAEIIINKLQKKLEPLDRQVQRQLKQKSYNSSVKKDWEGFAKQLKQKVKMEEKIKVCSSMLNELILNEDAIKNFSYKNANIFLFFLEAISIQELDLQPLNKDYQKEIKNEIIGKENSTLARAIRNDVFLHSKNVIKEKCLHKELMKLLKGGITCTSFFLRLADYMSEVNGKLNPNGVQTQGGQLMALENILKTPKEIEKEEISTKLSSDVERRSEEEELLKLLKKFIKEIGSKPNAKNGHEIMFNLLVNIVPSFGKSNSDSQNSRKLRCEGLEKIRVFRNNFFHNFHEQGEHPLRRNYVLKKGMHELLDHFFAYYFVREVCKEFKDLTLLSFDKQTFKEKISQLLKTTQETFKEYYPANQCSKIELRDDKSNPILSFIEEYLTLMSVIDNEHVIKERETKLEKSIKQVIHRKLEVIDRKHIYNKFKTLKDSEGNEILRTLKTEYGIWIPKHYFKQMVNYYKTSGNKALTEFTEIVNNDVCALRSFKKDYKLSTKKIIEIYDTFIKGEGISNLFDELKLEKSATSSIMDKLCGLRSRSNETITLTSDYTVKNVNGKKIDVVVDLVKSTRNCLEMLDDDILYPFLSMTIEEIFGDELFLDYFLSEESILNEKNTTRDFVIKLLDVEYMTPYVAQLIIANKLNDIITTEVFSKLIRHLVKIGNGECIQNLLQEIGNEQFMKMFRAGDIGELFEQINENNIRIMYCLFETPELVAGILRALKVSGQIQLVNKALWLLKHTVAKLYNNGKYDLVLELLKVKEVGDLFNKDGLDFDVLHVLRTMAQAYNKKHCYPEALDIFIRIQSKIPKESLNTLHGLYRMEDIQANKMYLLVLSDIAYTKHLIGEHKESYTKYKDLYDTVVKQLGISNDVTFFEIYKNSEKSPNNLVFDSKYLNILKILSDIAYKQKYLATNNDTNTKHYQEALTIYEEVYKIKATHAGFSQVIVKNMRDIAFVSNKLAGLKSSDRKDEVRLKQALSHYNRAFEMYAMVLNIQEREHWKTHPANSKIVQNIVCALNNIASINEKLSCLKESQNRPEEASKYRDEASYIYKEIKKCQKIFK